MRALGLLLRFYSYVFHLAVSLSFLVVAFVSATTGSPLHLDAVGFTPERATWWVLGLGVAGLISTLLALTGAFRLLFPIWAAVVLWLMIKGFFLAPTSFTGPSTFGWTVLLTCAAIAAFVGALWTLARPSKR